MIVADDEQQHLAIRACAHHQPERAIRRGGLAWRAADHVTEQPRFLNAACQLRTALPPLELLGAVKDIERRAGRELDADGAPAPGSLGSNPWQAGAIPMVCPLQFSPTLVASSSRICRNQG